MAAAATRNAAAAAATQKVARLLDEIAADAADFVARHAASVARMRALQAELEASMPPLVADDDLTNDVAPVPAKRKLEAAAPADDGGGSDTDDGGDDDEPEEQVLALAVMPSATANDDDRRIARVTAHTDGSCLGNPGPGGWAVLVQWLRADGAVADETMLAGNTHGEPPTTNQRMELEAALQGVRHLTTQPRGLTTPATLVTDSEYVCDGVRLWLPRWLANGWRTAARTPVKNQDLWRALHAELQRDARGLIQFRWVRGHGGDAGNERANARAQAEARRAVPATEGGGKRARKDASVP